MQLEGGPEVGGNNCFSRTLAHRLPPRDLVEKESFLDRNDEQLDRLARETVDLNISLVCGYVGRSGSKTGKCATNSAALIDRGEVVFRQHKMLLPTYDVFDEARYFVPADGQALFTLRGKPIAITICEDAWNDKEFWGHRLYQRDPVEELVRHGANVLLSINASPYHMGKRELRREVFATTARRYKLPLVYVNQVGGNDQLVFDGSSFALDAEGNVIASASSFSEDLVFVDFDSNNGDRNENLPEETQAVYEALVLGTRDYIHKCGFRKVLIGLSGGIDSSLTAAIAIDAVGAANVTGVGMPGPYSSEGSVTDARAMAENLGIRFELISITAAYDRVIEALDPVFAGLSRDVTEENLQSRLRGVTLMALSNKTGALVLTTGNKSELAVGYCTLYGDMCGGLAVISDVPKLLVYELSRIANQRHRNAIPESVFTKPPSAELRPDQKDSDSLPDYEILDCILRGYVEEGASAQDIAGEHGFDLSLIRDIINKVDRNEYKRQQAAPGLKVTTKAFGIGRRFPIAQGLLNEATFFAAVLCLAAFLMSQPAPMKQQVGPLPDGGFLLNSGWKLQPAGRQVTLDTMPMSTALSKDGKYLLVLNGGYKPPSISVLLAATMEELGRTPVNDGWLGLAFSPDGKFLYVGGGSKAAVYEFEFNDGTLTKRRTFEIVPEDKRTHRDFIGDVAVSPDGRLIYAAGLHHDAIHVINPQSGRVIEKWPTGRRPYRILFHPDGKSFLVSSWADGSIVHHSADSGERLNVVRLGQHPTDMIWR
ncbi:MAG: NAD+ synthase [Bryobacteraceae bacterium]